MAGPAGFLSRHVLDAPGRFMHRHLPSGLFARSALIIIVPMLLLQIVVAFVFMERHWQLVTRRLSEAMTRDIATIIDLVETFPDDAIDEEIVRVARVRMDLSVSIEDHTELPPPRPRPFFSILDDILANEINRQIRRPFWIDTVGNSNLVEIRIQLDDRVVRVLARRSQTYASNTHIFLVWMAGSSIVLLVIAILFLRGQIRPILTLARAAESFGKGQKLSEPFRPRGAVEIRKAGHAFILMRERIERQMEQRTAMLAGVSHDLRTILTRFRLQLALAGDMPELAGMDKDVDDMQSMLEGYMAFARNEAEEDVGTLNLRSLFDKLKADCALVDLQLEWTLSGDETVSVRPNAFTRLMNNLIANSQRYADKIRIEAVHSARWLTVIVDDDGPGIPAESREDVFKPFFRLDEARNLDTSGTGLGLAIARDVARSHGGDITLDDSPLGGLRALVRLPA
ncbi:ATP-binding protein [Rhizobiaceae bacterium BDR2-2]|uniref:histidine kinase n=2 Tax=Ectorhizobium quercum TaxID=2965071 RepID=A0AAE3SV40_9HYPH|nr:ATP-binding protein [Ectorhizobium quercum]MCX8996564.1 ATP-binding protein [Ectorhizobium quercum]